MRRIVDEVLRPTHSSLVLTFVLTISLFATYFVLVPAIIKQYERQLESERNKLMSVATRIEETQKKLDTTLIDLGRVQQNQQHSRVLLKEIHEAVVKKNAAPDSGLDRPKDN